MRTHTYTPVHKHMRTPNFSDTRTREKYMYVCASCTNFLCLFYLHISRVSIYHLVCSNSWSQIHFGAF